MTSLNALPAGGPNSVVFNASNMDILSSLLAQGQLVDLNITGVNAGDGLVVTKDAAAGITFGISTSGVAAPGGDIAGGKIDIDSTGSVLFNDAASLITTGGNAAAAGFDAGTIEIDVTTQGAEVFLSTNADINTQGGNATAGDADGGAGGSVTIDTNAGTITFTDTLIATEGGTQRCRQQGNWW